MSTFDKMIFDRDSMIVRKFSKKNITSSDWKLINFVFKSYKNSDDMARAKKLASTTYFKNVIQRWNSDEKIYEAYVWAVDNGQVDIDLTMTFIGKVKNDLLVQGVEKALALDIDDYHRSVLNFAIAKHNQDYVSALDCLQQVYALSDSLEKKRFYANSQRSVFHILKDRQSMSDFGLRYLKDNPDLVDMGYCFHIAHCAAYVGNAEALSYAVSRILNELIILLKNDKLFEIEYVVAFETSLKLFSFKHARAIAKKAQVLSLPQAEKLNKRLQRAIKDVNGWEDVVDQAYRRIKQISQGQIDLEYKGDEDVVVVVSTAAFGFNKIDYPDFRSSLKKMYSHVLAACQNLDLNVKIDVKFGTHGAVSYPIPFISYHTISDANNGLHIKETDRRHCLSFDTKGYSGWSEFSKRNISHEVFQAVDPVRANDFYESDYIEAVLNGSSKYVQPEGVNEVLPDKYLLVALQLEADAVYQLSFISFEEMVGIVVKVARASGLGVVVKRHPHCKSVGLTKLLAPLEESGQIVLSQGNIKHLIDGSEGVVVVNSSVGAEALLEKKPVYVFGDSEYMAACHVCRTEADFKAALSSRKPKLSEAEFEAFWTVFRDQYSFDIRRDDADQRVLEILKQMMGIKDDAPVEAVIEIDQKALCV